MKALTVCQPYAELIVSGAKPIENRTWLTNYRGPLVIHAGKSRAWLDADDDPDDYAFGAIVGVVDVVDCVPVQRLPDPLRTHVHAHGPMCWILENPRRVAPIAWRGETGLFNVPDHVVAGVAV